MQNSRIREIIEALEGSLGEFTGPLDGLSEARAHMRPAENRWSALLIAEHLGVVEDRFRGFVENAAQAESPKAVDTDRESTLARQMGNRTTRAEAPEAARPTGRFATLGEAVTYFRESRSKTIQVAESGQAGLKELAFTHPRFGALSGEEVLLLAAFHTRRHAEQLRETLQAV